MSTKIVLIGAGSAMFGLGSLGNILRSKVLEGCTVVLHDIDGAALQKVERVARRFMQERKLSHTLVVTTSREEALQNAQFCIIAIEVGNRYRAVGAGLAHPPAIRHSSGLRRKRGPGGLFHSLRIIPPILRDVR